MNELNYAVINCDNKIGVPVIRIHKVTFVSAVQDVRG
jgi:hypothetical protein